MERELSGGQIEFLTTEKGGMFDKMAAPIYAGGSYFPAYRTVKFSD